jgi:hypothetical protein
MLGPGQIGAQLGEHAPACLDRSQLMGVSDQDGLGAGRGGSGQQLVQLAGADHGGLVYDHQGLSVQR